MHGYFRMFLMLVLITLPCARAYGHTVITRLSDGETVTLPQLSKAAAASDVTLVGESHDDPYHHELQLDLIRLLQAGKLSMALGLEMMQSDYQKQLDDWVAGMLSEPEMQQVFEKNWSDWHLYREIFVFAREQRIPMVALNVPLAMVRKVSQQGLASLTPEERRDLPAGTSCDLTNPQITFLRKTFRGVGHHLQNGKNFNHFCEAQTLRNSGMARNIARYLEKQPRRKMVVLTGVWHAVKYAIPDQLQRLGSGLNLTVILPQTPYLNGMNSGESEADYLVEL